MADTGAQFSADRARQGPAGQPVQLGATPAGAGRSRPAPFLYRSRHRARRPEASSLGADSLAHAEAIPVETHLDPALQSVVGTPTVAAQGSTPAPRPASTRGRWVVLDFEHAPGWLAIAGGATTPAPVQPGRSMALPRHRRTRHFKLFPNLARTARRARRPAAAFALRIPSPWGKGSDIPSSLRGTHAAARPSRSAATAAGLRLAQQVGARKGEAMPKTMGIRRRLRRFPALALGQSEVRLIDLTSPALRGRRQWRNLACPHAQSAASTADAPDTAGLPESCPLP